ncbi:hypothetical protein OESDEN_00268 [Oesophagostomum dentatum]|uniref:Uncharacterized protein n=1 Tax=Oesophagostomum dentatum TaxID=61180 RepID=A0A0B1TR77_OESDE|nr:hypothetical protein OESDEN_00268 [Oesophagostomum dentatum]
MLCGFFLDGHFHEDTLISHVHNANVKVDADQESKGGHINNDLKQGSLEDKARQIPLGNVPIKTAGQAETLLVQVI